MRVLRRAVLAALTRAEPGNLRFDVVQGDDPLIFELRELYTGKQAFQAHRARLYDSRWGRESHGIAREFTREQVLPRIRAEMRHDHEAIAELLTMAFDGPDEARLVDMLRRDGHLALSLVAEAAGTIRSNMIIAMGLLESLTIYGLLIAFLLIGKLG